MREAAETHPSPQFPAAAFRTGLREIREGDSDRLSALFERSIAQIGGEGEKRSVEMRCKLGANLTGDRCRDQ
jgi:hypothetical protein